MQLLRQFIFEVELSETEELKNVLYQYGSYLTEKNYLERKFFEYMAELVRKMEQNRRAAALPVSDGHTAAVFVSFEQKPSKEEILKIWEDFKGVPQELELPSAPKQFIHYFQEDDRPQAKLDRNIEGGMAVSVGRLREDTMFDYKFVCLSHNTLRGAAGGGVLLAELLAAKGYMD